MPLAPTSIHDTILCHPRASATLLRALHEAPIPAVALARGQPSSAVFLADNHHCEAPLPPLLLTRLSFEPPVDRSTPTTKNRRHGRHCSSPELPAPRRLDPTP